MDLILNINQMNKDFNLKHNIHQQKKVDKKDLKNIETIEDNNKYDNRFKQEIIDIQNNFNKTQNKINILQLANENLNKISTSLDNIKNTAENNMQELDSLNLTNELKKIDKMQEKIKSLLSIDIETSEEFSSEISTIGETLKNINTDKNNPGSALKVKKILKEVNKTINSISSTKDDLNEIQNDLITSIKSLSITLENIIASNNKVRHIDEVQKMSEITQQYILKEAKKSIFMQLTDKTSPLNELLY